MFGTKIVKQIILSNGLRYWESQKPDRLCSLQIPCLQGKFRRVLKKSSYFIFKILEILFSVVMSYFPYFFWYIESVLGILTFVFRHSYGSFPKNFNTDWLHRHLNHTKYQTHKHICLFWWLTRDGGLEKELSLSKSSSF